MVFLPISVGGTRSGILRVVMCHDEVLLETTLSLPLRVRGKVRDVYDLGDHLLFVASDRISAFDCILGSGIPCKGRVLNADVAVLVRFPARHDRFTCGDRGSCKIPEKIVQISKDARRPIHAG